MNHISMSLLHKFIILAISIIGMVGFGLYIFDIDNAAWHLFAGTPLGLLCVIGVYEFIKKMYSKISYQTQASVSIP